MNVKFGSVLLAVSVLTPGCTLLEESPPNVVEAPPYWQSHDQRELDQLSEMWAFHEKETSDLSDEMNIVHNREMERLVSVEDEMKSGRLRQDEKQQGGEEKKWSWFNFSWGAKEDTE